MRQRFARDRRALVGVLPRLAGAGSATDCAGRLPCRDLDGRTADNPARYMNHSCDGNCEAINYDGEIWMVARCDISEGEELVFDYGYDMEHFLDHPCNCGAKNCIGYIVREDQRRKVRKLLNKQKK